MTRILVIEDGLDVRACIIELLEVEGFEVLAADSSPLGVRLAKEQLPDLILCDVMMPELDGYEVLADLRQHPQTQAIPFIFLTAKATKADLRYGMELGADDYLTKPFTRAELLGAIAARLAKRKAIFHHYTLNLSQTTQALNQLAYYDGLTGLPNKLLLNTRFNQLLDTYNAQDLSIPFFYLDIDNFRRINNTLGFAIGDQLLKQISKRLYDFIGDRGIVARLSNDEFAVLLEPQLLNPAQFDCSQTAIAQMAQELLDIVGLPYALPNQTIFLTACLGMVLYPQDGHDMDTLIRHADAALHEAKSHGSNYLRLYQSLPGLAPDQIDLENDLRYALQRSEMQVYYQPQIDFKTRTIDGVEALLRWNHSKRGMISPAEFIPLAESTGLIVSIGEWVLQTACQQAKTWQAMGFQNLQIAVNLSACQFNQPNLCEAIARILQETGLHAELLDLELTESTLIQDIEPAISTLKELRTLGIRISIDDFGTGYSSLRYLQQFPFDALKIDRSFVQSISQNNKNAAITTTIIQMAHQLSLKVIAEGVETSAELAFLMEHGCDAGQGYLFSPPVSSEDLTALLQRQTETGAIAIIN